LPIVKVLLRLDVMETTQAPRQAPALPPLRPEEAVARGSERSIFEWEAEPALLLKLIHPQALRRDVRGRATDPLFRRELKAWQAARRYSARTGRPAPVAEIVAQRAIEGGFVQLVRKVADAEGRMGPTLDKLIERDAFGAGELALLNALVADLAAAGIVVHDARPANFVLETAPGGATRFVLVDGFGDRAALPLRAWLPSLARRRLFRALRRTARDTGLAFDGRRFALTAEGLAPAPPP
jgi:hypothetical protein